LEKWDSLAAMNLVSAIEEEFEVELTTKEIMKMYTIGMARQLLQNKSINV
jgi:acyl carrier protein